MNNTENFENLQFNRTVNTIWRTPEHFPLHWHKYAELVMLPLDAVVDQQPRLRVQQTVYQLAPGDLLFIWPGELHEVLANRGQQMVGLQFSAAIINELPEFAPFISRFHAMCHIRHEESPALAEYMAVQLKQMFAMNRETGRFCGVESLICLLELFMEYGRYLDQNVPFEKMRSLYNEGRVAEKMTRACNYMIENSERDLTLESVADYVGYSSCYFSRVFKQVTNYSFVEYLTIQRVRHAQALLADPAISVGEVVGLAGFKSISTFNRVFKQYGGCSPSEYRKFYNDIG